MYDRTTPIDAFLAAAAAKQPAPGGGSVAALVGALAAAMGEMVLNYSVGKKGLEAHQPAIESALHELTKAREVMLRLMEEDQVAYAALTAAKKLPEGSPERESALPPALVASIRAPQALGATALAILGCAERVVGMSNKYLLSDLAVCADLAMVTARCAVHNIKANLPDLPDPAERQKLAEAAEGVLAKAVTIDRRLSPAIWTRMAEET